MFPNIIHLDSEKSIDLTGKALKLIAESYNYRPEMIMVRESQVHAINKNV